MFNRDKRNFNQRRERFKKTFFKEEFILGIGVVVQNNNVDAALRKFKKKVQEEGILQEVRKRQEYVKPSEKRRKEKAANKARYFKKLEKSIKK